MIPFSAALLTISLAAVTPGPISRMVLKDGTVYLLKEPPRIWGGRIIFTTIDGKPYSLSESEVDTIGLAPQPTPAPRTTYNPQDSRDLGAIARQQRESKGLSAPVAPKTESTRRTRAAPKPVRTRRPALSRTPSPEADKASHG